MEIKNLTNEQIEKANKIYSLLNELQKEKVFPCVILDSDVTLGFISTPKKYLDVAISGATCEWDDSLRKSVLSKMHYNDNVKLELISYE